ncbi:YfhH family protein [Tuberibacillus calidus]|uniref:YfhH family protein n=1 Tax=Tuberibacillus calidus TaxID=340097 RepID=UPI000408AF2C|nr:YfhH family protein [Tuberibacillus calidus]
MMPKRYSQMSREELEEEIKSLKVKEQRAEQAGMINEVEVLQRKQVMAASYLLNPEDFKQGDVMVIKEGDGTPFKIEYLDGVFAWGYYGNETEMRAFPIALLVKESEA